MDQVCLPPVHLQPTAEADLVPVVDLDFGVLDGQPVQVRVWVREFPEHAVDLAGVQEPQEQVELQLVSLTLQLPLSHEKTASPV